MKSSRFHIILFLSLLAFAAVCLPASAATLEGTVLDPSGQVVPNARVSLLQSLAAVGERQADSSGVYRFEGIEAGSYQLTASSPGLSGSTIDVELAKSEVKKQDIHLKVSALVSKVVVSATLGGALAPQIGSSLSVIDRQEIEDRGTQNILEVIRGVPGIEVNQTGRRGGTTGVFIRGGESKYNAVMVDGIPLNEFGGYFDMSSLPTDGVERVEVIRGPESALHGSNAVSGVINVVSQRGEGPPSFTALAEGGSYATRRFATGGSGLHGGFNWSFNLSRLDSDGVVENDNYRNQSAFLNLGYRQTSRQFHFSFFGNANDRGAPGPYGSDPAGLFPGIDTISRGKQNLFGYQAGYVERFSSRLRQVTTVSFATNDLFYISTWGNYFSENLRGILNTRSEITLSNNNMLAAGFEFNREQIRHTYITDANFSPFLIPRTSLAYFVEDRWNPTSRLYLIAGLRLDHIRTPDLPPDAWGSRPFIPANTIVKANPRVSAAYIAQSGDSGNLFGATRLHGSFGTGIRPPDGFELAFTNNPKLKPEKSISFDAGIEQRLFATRAILDFTYFFNRFEDQIVTLGGTIANLSNYTSDNLKNSRAQGLEITFRIHPVRSLEFRGDYTFVDSSVLALDGSSEANDPYHVGQELLRRPRHSGSYSVTWRYKRLTLHTRAYIRGSVLDVEPNYGSSFYTNPGYTRADAGFTYQLPRGVEVYGQLNNLLDRKYEETLGFPALELNFMAGMKFRIPAE